MQARRSTRDCSVNQGKFSQNIGPGNAEKWEDCFNDRTDLIGDKLYISVKGSQ